MPRPQPPTTYRYGSIVLRAPRPGMTHEQVRDHFAANGYPELTTCAIEITTPAVEGASGEVAFEKPAPPGIAKSSSAGSAANVNFVKNQGARG